MKKAIIYSISILMSAAVGVSCVQDLDTMPIDPSVKTIDTAFASPASYEQYLNYAYSYFSLVSQTDPGSSDIAISDAGQSEFIRQYMICNELTTDALKCVWNDDYVATLQTNQWASTNTALIAVYTRALKGITICNQFLDPAISGDAAVTGRGHESKLAEIHTYRAELRALRVFYYAVLLDMFGNPPVMTWENIGSTGYPEQMDNTDSANGRKLLFENLVTELKALTNDSSLPDFRVAYPRLSKGAVWAMLARLYLNAEVYTGTAHWQEAKDAAKNVIEKGGYQLWNNYWDMFRQDNSTNGAQNEFIIAAIYDCEHTQSWGGTTHLVYSVVNSDIRKEVTAAFGVTEREDMYKNQWNGYHSCESFVEGNFDNIDLAATGVVLGGNGSGIDGRAAFYKFGDTFTNAVLDIASGYSCLKWVPITSAKEPILVKKDIEQSSADFPVYRLAEMYLIYAEAELRLNGSLDAYAADLLTKLGQRANGADYTLPATIDLDWMLKERTRELMWEGHRRTDLIRFGYFTRLDYPWPYKNGVADGRATIPDYRKVFPIIQSDIVANPTLKQNPGY